MGIWTEYQHERCIWVWNTGTNRAAHGHDRSVRQLSRNTTSVPQVLHLPTPYNLRSLARCVFATTGKAGQLKRFGSEVFLAATVSAMNQMLSNGRETPLDVPAGPDTWWAGRHLIHATLWGEFRRPDARSRPRGPHRAPDQAQCKWPG